MPSPQTLEAFIQAVEQQPHDEVIAQYYTEDASIQENQNDPRVGLPNLIENERKMLHRALNVQSACIRPYFQSDNKVAIRWKFRFEWKDHSITEIEEMAYQEWEGEKIKREQFFYDPQQFVPKPAI
ncbi:MAG: nuclear transport factor 2 family protein [Bacteroidota bacterium]